MAQALFPVLTVLGFVLTLFSLAFLIPLGYALATDEPTVEAFSVGFVGTFVIGLLMHLLTKRYRRELRVRDGFLLVSTVWAGIPAVACIPMMYFLTDLSFTDSYYEMVSALTTTGGTALAGLDQLPHSINIWRMFLTWLGGMGILVLAVAILPLLGVGGSQVFKAETPGPMKDNKLTPRITETAKALYLIYFVLTVLCAVAYKVAGMNGLDAVLHAMSTMALSGFSSHDASFAYWDSQLIESVAVVFMLVASINFAIHFTVWRSKTFKPYSTCPETRWSLMVMLGASVLVAAYLLAYGQYATFAESFRHALFNTVSVATTSGFANTDYARWPLFAPLLMLSLCMFATAAGSTGGGIKMMRFVILLKQASRELSRTLHPRAVNPVMVSNTPIENQVIFGVLAFMLMYGFSIIVLTMLLIFSGLDPVSSLTGVIASINCTGPGLGVVGPASNYSVLTDFQTWVMTFAMLLGRLELFPILLLFTPTFWRK
ncbi:MAG: potassium transporter TrkG [Limnobacter sp.]|nr:potassium transporter TrkG [Limnobacter sp.]